MTDISKYLPEHSKTVSAIYAAYKKAGDAQPVRGYLGASIIGHPCERYLWYCFRQCCKPEFDGRMYRLFETGDLEEHRFVKDLESIGCKVHEHDIEGDQFEVSALGGHFSGHLDGATLGIPEAPKTWHVLEFKTCNAKSFRDLVKKGVKDSKPQHYAQMMVYMHLTGMKRALYLARNKDTDELYSERVRYDKAEAQALMDRAGRIITATSPPARISERRDYYQCGWCDAKEICWGSKKSALPIPSLSCRQCCHATPITDGEGAQWTCEKQRFLPTWMDGQAPASYEAVKCDHHLTLPGLLPFAEPTNYRTDDTGNNLIEFTSDDGAIWWHSANGIGGYSSRELLKLPALVLKSTLLQKAKDVFGATATGHQEDILKRYPRNDSRIIWEGPSDDMVKAWLEKYGEDLAKMKPVLRCDNLPQYDAVELEGGRLAIVWYNGTAEIREEVKCETSSLPD